MDEQLSFFETSQPHRLGLVLGAFPDHHATQQIRDLVNLLRKILGLSGRMRPINHLHVTLPFPSRAKDTLETAVENINRACQAVAELTSPFEIKFDWVKRFGPGLGNRPVVLTDDGYENSELRSLHGSLCAEFVKNISGKISIPKFSPHLTLLYDKQQIAPMRVEPVCWTVKEIALVLSEVGATKYHRLGRWVLSK
jgi:2'-5' RNA ligase